MHIILIISHVKVSYSEYITLRTCLDKYQQPSRKVGNKQEHSINTNKYECNGAQPHSHKEKCKLKLN